MGKKNKDNSVLKLVFKYGFLSAFIIACGVILVESAIPGNISGDQSDGFTDIIDGNIKNDYDKENVIEIKDFDLKFNNQKDEYLINEEITYSISYSPENTSYRELEWNYVEDHLEISSANGVNTIKFLKSGIHNFSVKSTRKPELEKFFQFNIKDIPVESVTLDGIEDDTVINLNINDNFSLTSTVLPTTASNLKVNYTSSDPKVATVDENGVILAKSGGDCVITASSDFDSSIKDSVKVHVYAETFVELTTLTFKDITELYPNKSTKFTIGQFGPEKASFDASKLKFDFDNQDGKLTLSAQLIGNNQISVTVNYKITGNITSDIVIPVNATYDGRISDNFTITIKPLKNLSIESLTSTETINKTGLIYQNTYYENNKDVIESLSVKIPFNSDISNYSYKYITSTVGYEIVKGDLSVKLKNYKELTITLKSGYTLLDGQIKFFPNKNNLEEFILINVSYSKKQVTAYIDSVEFTKISSETSLFYKNEPIIYEDLLDFKIKVGGTDTSKFSSLFNNTALIITPDDNGSIINIDSNNKTVTTVGNGTVNLNIQSKYEQDINLDPAKRKINFDVKINVVNTPNESWLNISNYQTEESIKFTDPKAYETTLGKGDKLYIDYHLDYSINFLDGTSFLLSDYYSLNSLTFDNLFEESMQISEGQDFINFSSDVELTTLAGGKTILEYYSENGIEDISTYEKVILNIDHKEIDQTQFKLTFEKVSNPEYNDPTEDFSKIALDTQIQAIPVMNQDATNKKVYYQSSDFTILEVDKDTGLISSRKNKTGTASITCYSVDNPDIKATKTIQVVDTVAPFVLTSDGLGGDKFSSYTSDGVIKYKTQLDYGRPYSFKITTEIPTTSTDISFSVKKLEEKEDYSSVSVDASGNITTRGLGKSLVTIKYGGKDTVTSYSAEITIDVQRNTKYTWSEISTFVRKTFGHYGLFLLTAVAGIGYIQMQFKDPKHKLIVIAIYTVIGFALAGFSELIQMFTPGRGPAWKDVGIDFAGFVTSTLIYLLFVLSFMLYDYIKKKKEIKNLNEVKPEETKEEKPQNENKK